MLCRKMGSGFPEPGPEGYDASWVREGTFRILRLQELDVGQRRWLVEQRLGGERAAAFDNFVVPRELPWQGGNWN